VAIDTTVTVSFRLDAGDAQALTPAPHPSLVAPVLIYKKEPEYSPEARRAGYQGTVVLSLFVGADGAPRDVKVTRALGLGLDEKAVEAAQAWQYKPTMQDGRPGDSPPWSR